MLTVAALTASLGDVMSSRLRTSSAAWPWMFFVEWGATLDRPGGGTAMVRWARAAPAAWLVP